MCVTSPHRNSHKNQKFQLYEILLLHIITGMKRAIHNLFKQFMPCSCDGHSQSLREEGERHDDHVNQIQFKHDNLHAILAIALCNIAALNFHMHATNLHEWH